MFDGFSFDDEETIERSILFVGGDSTSFMISAIIKNLKEAGYGVIPVEPTVEKLNAHREDTKAMIIYLDDYIYTDREVLVYIRDLCLGGEQSIILVGDEGELKVAHKALPEEIIFEVFARPLDIKALIEGVDRLLKQNADLVKKRTILLVDDDGDFLKLARSWLGKRYHVIIVNSGMQAITYLATNTPDLILLDFEMPITSGPQVMEMIRAESRTAKIPIFFLTGKSDTDSVMQALNQKPEGYILKSSDRYRLEAYIDNFFEGKKET
ncbi:MAG: response regulator [Lachnospiraceae bacterium]|nr:response regulator [Lachnospiraceae bacterium]